MKREELLGRFGLHEFEDLAFSIMSFLESEEEGKMGDFFKCYKQINNYPNTGFGKPFAIEDVTKDYTGFAIFAASGFIEPCWFPKGYFFVSDSFIKKLK